MRETLSVDVDTAFPFQISEHRSVALEFRRSRVSLLHPFPYTSGIWYSNGTRVGFGMGTQIGFAKVVTLVVHPLLASARAFMS